MKLLTRLTRGLLSLNLGFFIRFVRFGWRDATVRLANSYGQMEPFGVPSQLVDQIPIAEKSAILSKRHEFQIAGAHWDIGGSLPIHELFWVLQLLLEHRPKSVLEIGTFFGSTTQNLARNLRSATIHTIDLPPVRTSQEAALGQFADDDFELIKHRKLGEAFRSDPTIDNVVQHLGDTAKWNFPELSDRPSFFFIDGSHTYEYVRNDTLRCLQIADSPAVFVWHDCELNHPGVPRWLGELVQLGAPVQRIDGTSLAFARFEQPWIDRILQQFANSEALNS